MKEFLKNIRYLIEALIVKLALSFFYILGKKNASNFGSFLARAVGKYHYSHKLALKNLSNAFPSLNQKQKDKIIGAMWDNLGRVVGEYVFISKENPEQLVKKHIIFDEKTLRNVEFIKENFKQGGIIFSGHIGNWEVGPKSFINLGFEVNTVYRPLNNKYVEEMTASIRGTKLIKKSSQGNRQIIEAIKKGEFVIILADQKISEGEWVDFFHDKAITTTSLARIALKYGIPLIPARSIRIGKQFKFKVDIERPLDFQKTNDLNRDVLNLTRSINQKLEQWISEYPSQWFWVHNRWKR